MSRASVKSIRQIRANESLQFRKTILKGAGNSASSQEAMANMAEQVNAQYEEKLAKLNKAKSKTKIAAKVSNHKFEWTKEQEQLNKTASAVERELMTMLSKLLVETALEGVLVDVSDEIVRDTGERKEQEASLVSQLGDIKAMVRQLGQQEERVRRSKDKGQLGKTPSHRQHQEQQALLRSSQSTSVIPTAMLTAALTAGDPQRRSMTDDSDVDVEDKEQMSIPAETSTRTHMSAAEHSEPVSTEALLSERSQSADSPSKRSNRNTESSIGASGQAAAAGIMAQLFLQVHQSQDQLWSSLANAAASLHADVAADRRRILSQLHEQSTELLADEITAEIHLEAGDDAETELFIEETTHKLHSMMNMHKEMLAVLTQQAELTHAKYGTSAQEPCGGWKREDHDMLVKIIKRAELAGNARKLLTEQFRQQLSHIPYDSVLSHEQWYREIKLLQAKKHELVQSHQQSLADLIQSSKADLVAFRAQRVEERKVEAENQRFEERRQDLHMLLAQQRAEKDVQDALTAQHVAAMEREQQEAHEAAVAKARLRAQEMQVQVDAYRARKAAEADAEAEKKRAEDLAREQQLKAQIESNREQVESRREIYWQKEEARKRKIESELQREVKRLELLAKIAEQCPYWEDLQNVESKLDHVTVAALSSMYHKGEELTRGHIPMMGFTDKAVVKDTRFKLISALRNAGVAHSEHARLAVARINPQPHLAIHGLL